LAFIHATYARGGAVNHAALGRNSVTRAATLLFGSWDNALREAGLDPAQVRLYREPWTPVSLLEEIQRKARAGEPLNARDVSPYSLRRRGGIFFGSWDATLAAAGLDPAKVRKSKTRGNRRKRGRSVGPEDPSGRGHAKPRRIHDLRAQTFPALLTLAL
jgi:hypothetical protein